MAIKKRRGIRAIIIVLVALAVVLLGWQRFRGDGGGRPPFNTVTVDRGDLEQTITATGSLHPLIQVEVGSQVSGNLSDVLVDFNDEVEKGQVLARLDSSTFEAALQQAEAELDSAEADLMLAETEAHRMRQLRERDLVPQADVDRTEARLRQAQATVRIRSHARDRARTEVERCTIYSPIDGIVISRAVDVGQTVAASMTAPVLFTIANDLTQMQIHSHVPEADIGGIRAGQRVEFTVDAHPHTFTGQVVQVRNAPIIEQHVVMYDTVISVSNPDRLLKPGMTATVLIVTDSREDVLRVRNTALRVRLPDRLLPDQPELPDDGETWRLVYRLAGGDPQGRLEAISVRTGVSDGVWTVVYEGIHEGDVLVTGINLEAQAQSEGRSLFGPGPAQF